MIELRGLTVRIDTGRWSALVLDSIDLVVPDGRLTVVLGGPGAGKSMAVAAVMSALPAGAETSGQVLIDGVHLPPGEAPAPSAVGCAPQHGVTAFPPSVTVGERLRELRDCCRGWSVEQACAAAHFPLDKLGLHPGQMSGGEATRAGLAAALISAPRILIADASTDALDYLLKYAVWESLRAYADSGAAVLAITNDVDILTATGFADGVVVMDSGRIVAAADSIASVEWPEASWTITN